MKRILVTGSVGQIGSELTPALRKIYGNDNVVAGGHRTKPDEKLLSGGPFETVDCGDVNQVRNIIDKYNIGTIYHLAAILSAVGEKNPQLAWDVNINGI